MDGVSGDSTIEALAAESSAAALQRQSPICVICRADAAIYTCPRCTLRTCSLSCSTAHKTLGSGCSGIRNKAAYVPMNQYGYMTLMSDYTFLEEVGRKVGEVGKEIVQGGYTASTNGAAGRSGRDGRGRGWGRGRGRGAAQAKAVSKRDVLKIQLDFRDIEIEFLPNGMERRTLNQSTWDSKNKTALFTIEFRFHPPRSALAPHAQPTDPPFAVVAHRIALETPLLAALQMHVAERHRSKKEKGVPPWVLALALPDEDVPDSFTPPLCVMGTSLDPLAALNANRLVPHPGRILRQGFHKLDPTQTLGAVLKHKHLIEFPTIDVWEEESFQGIIVDDKGAVVHDPADEPRPKRRRLNPKQAQQAINGLLSGYGSDEESDRPSTEQHNWMNLLGGYAGSDEEEGGEGVVISTFDADEWGDDDAEGETDEEYEGNPEELANMLRKLRDAGALRDPKQERGVDEDQVDWGESGDEEGGDS